MKLNLFIFAQIHGLIVVGMLGLVADGEHEWSGLVILSVFVGSVLYEVNQKSMQMHSTDTLLDLLTARTPQSVFLWINFYLVDWVLGLGLLALMGEGW